MNFIGPKSKKKASMQRFISRLYKSYEASFGDSPNAHAKALAKIQGVMKARRLSLLKNVVDAAQKKDGISRMKERTFRIRRLTRQAEDLAEAIENKVLSLSAANNGYVSVRKIHAELNKDALFTGSRAVVYEMLRHKGFFFRKIGDRWKMYRTKAIDERLNLSQIQSVSYSNMMEVKHSPVSKVEYRPDRNGAAQEEDDDLESLFDGAVPKSETPPSEESDNPVAASSCSIITNDTDSAQLVEEMDVDLVKQELKAEAEAVPELEPKPEPEPEPIVESETSKEVSEGPFEIDLKLLGLDLPEAESIEKSENGEISVPSALRDTGDDLDALMSKINDLVEDCMEPQAGEAAPVLVAVEDEIVEIPDDDMESEVVAPKEVKPEISAESAPEVSASDQEVTKVAAVSVIVSNAPAVEKMETDEDSDVVCIDSPATNSNSNISPAVDEMPLTDIVTTVEQKVDEEEEEGAEKKEQDAVGKCMTKAKRKETEKTKSADEDEIFLIEDDEEDLKRASGSVKPQDMREDIDDFDTESERAFQQEIEKEIEKDFDSGAKLGEKEQNGEDGGDGEQASAKLDDKDMDIVCLDDSLEEPDDKEEEEEQQPKVGQIEGLKEKNDSEDFPEPARRESVEASKKDEEPEKVEEAKEAATSDPAPVIEPKEVSAGDTAPPSEPKKPSADDDDDVVILDDDDDETDAMATAGSEKKDENSSSMSVADNESAAKTAEATAETSATAKSSAIISDNSDNARDGVEEKEQLSEEKADKDTAVPHPSESNSSSSNLLKESTPREPDENLEFPPAKRIRLSQDETNSRSSTLSQEESKAKIERQDSTEDKENIKESKKIKRVHSTDSLTSEFKKPKTEGDSLKPSKTEQDSSKKRGDLKSLPLYPPPNLDTPSVDLSLDFLKRFKKSIHKMNKTDLEELVLQKIVEAIVHKSEFSEMRDLIEKQEKVIAGHRVKIAELTKQFRDLEMVHNRVLKDLETKNSQFIMPVKITRAVGLQVFFPNKKPDQPILPALSHPVQSPSNQPSRSSSTASVPMERSFSSPADGFTSNAVKQAPTNVATPTAITPVQTPVAAPRRGCVQKLTPLRPDTPRNSPLNRAVPSNVVSSTTPTTVLAKDAVPKLLNRALAQKSRVSSSSFTGNVAVEPVPTPSPQPVAPSPPVAERLKQVAMTPPGIATKKTKDYVLRRYRPKLGQSDPQTVAHPLPPAATTVTSHVPPPAQPSQAAKAKRMANMKPVIDLTEEDDLMPVTSTPKAPPTAVALPTSTTIAAGPKYKVSVIPQQQLQQQPKPNPPKQTPQRPIAPKPNGVALAVRQALPNPSRYRHPAPLPSQPIHSSNPAWKLPPARPTIRISNLESGIVISWTIEDTAKDKYAESTSYQIYAYQETSGPPLVESWRHVGDVKAMLLPMAVTLTQFQEGQRYYFAVRAVDAYNRCGPFSCAKTWS